MSARVALWQAVKAFDLKPGQRVALPAFCCGSELEPFLMAGLDLSFFSVGEDLSPDPASFREAIGQASLALATHYFGLPVNLSQAREMARDKGIPLIEDCAHALYAKEGSSPIGISSDAAVFSFWKTVALPDGGALYMPSAKVRTAPKPPPGDLVKRATRQLLTRTMRSHPLAIVRRTEGARQNIRQVYRGNAARPSGQIEVRDEAELMKLPHEILDAGMSSRSLRIWRGTDHNLVRETRRRRYQEIEAGLTGMRGFSPMASRLPEGACPLYFPVLVEDGAGLRRTLAAEGVGVKHIWPYFHPAVPWDRFPKERLWKDKALGFPVHQSLGDDDVLRMVDVIKWWNRQ